MTQPRGGNKGINPSLNHKENKEKIIFKTKTFFIIQKWSLDELISLY
jgi:hypothetical protein